MVWLHLYSRKNHLCRQLCLQRTSLEDKLQYSMSAKSIESTIIQSKVMRIAHLKAFRKPKIDYTGMATWIIQMTVRTTASQTFNLIWRETMTMRIRNAQSSGIWVLHETSPDWLGQHRSERYWRTRCRFRSIQWNQAGISELRNSWTECINMFHQLLYAAWPSVSFADKLWANGM